MTSKAIKKLSKLKGATFVTIPMRKSQDVPNFLRLMDQVQRRTAKSKLHFS